MYNDNGNETILPLLRKNNMWLKGKKFLTHKEGSIGFIKYVSPTITLQTAIRSRIELVICSMQLMEEDTTRLIT